MKYALILAAVTALAATACLAEAVPAERYVNAQTLNCRAGPSASAQVVYKLKYGVRVTVLREEGAWSVLDSPYCYASRNYLSSEAPEAPISTVRGDNTEMASAPSNPVRAFKAAPSKRKSSAFKQKSFAAKKRSPGFSSGVCPCSGNHVCIGPRGGRYCITSGGNKRYGV